MAKQLSFKLYFYILVLISCLVVFLFTFNSSQDFCPDYKAAQYYLQSQPIYQTVSCDGLHHSAHPPITILMLIPFTFLPITYAGELWALISVICFIFAIVILLKSLNKFTYLNACIVLLISIIWPILFVANIAQNIIQILLLIIVAAWILQNKKQFALAGILMGFAGLFRPWMLIILLGYLVLKQYKTTLWGFGVFITGTALSFIILGPDTFMTYIHEISKYEMTEWFPNPNNISLSSLPLKLITLLNFQNDFSALVATRIGMTMTFIIIIFTILFIWFRNSKIDKKMADISLGLLLTVSLISFPIVWDWSMVILLLPVTIIILTLQRLPRQSVWWYILFGLGLFTILDPFMTSIILRSGTIYELNYIISIFKTIGIICFAAAQFLLLIQYSKLSKINSSQKVFK